MNDSTPMNDSPKDQSSQLQRLKAVAVLVSNYAGTDPVACNMRRIARETLECLDD